MVSALYVHCNIIYDSQDHKWKQLKCSLINEWIKNIHFLTHTHIDDEPVHDFLDTILKAKSMKDIFDKLYFIKVQRKKICPVKDIIKKMKR